MSQNIQQIFTNNPASSMVSTDLLYLGRSPYNTSDDFAITFANFVASIGTATPTASTISRWDSHINMSSNNFLDGYTTTATAGGTTTLTVSSSYLQYFTGSTTQIVVLPVVSTLVLGYSFRIVNNSTGNVTVNSSGANLVKVVEPGATLIVTCILLTGTTASSWDIRYSINYGTNVSAWLANPTSANLLDAVSTTNTGTGALVFNNSPTFVTPTLGAALATSINFGDSTLSTYVTGTWTPTITPATLGDWSVSYATQLGTYTQVGNKVTVVCQLTFTPTFTTASGVLTINNLPVALNATYYGVGPVGFTNSNWTWGTGITQLFAAAHVSSTTVNIIGIGSTKANVTFAVSNIVASGVSTQLYFTVTYLI